MTRPIRSPHLDADDRTDDERTEAAQLYVQQLKAFYVHASVFAGSMLIIFLVNLLTNMSADVVSDWGAWWSLWALLGWGSGIAVHGLVVRFNRPSSSSSAWAQRQIDKVLSS